ncbi:sugar-binding transcriptional regulator [Frankia sp. EAN1pec]|uniref:sugar-binding domain-containing protein n=1 Tax=Parafrankia sp. (strain EAN1pec) TaxID=298653 RepID=UPI0012FC270D
MAMRASPDRDRLRLLTKVARLYHEQGVRQPEIAERLNLSQARVSRLLKEASELGIVRTIIVPPPGVHADIEDELIRRYGLRDVMVVDVEGSAGDITAALGASGATYLDMTLQNDDVIGVSSWSATLLAAVDAMRPRHTLNARQVIQLMGGVGSPDAQMQATRLTGRLATLTGAAPLFVPSPGLVGSATLQQALLTDPAVQTVREVWSELTVALVGIGTTTPSPLLRQSGNGLSDADQRTLRDAGAVGDVCLRYFDEAGQPVVADLDQRIIGIDRETLLGTARRIAIAGGQEKATAIRAAVLGRWVNILITDLGVAGHLLGAPPSGPSADRESVDHR